MTGFVKGNGTLLLCCHNLGLLLQTSNNTVYGSQEIILTNYRLAITGCYQSSLVADVGNIGTTETGSLTCQEVDIQTIVGFQRTQVHLEDFLTFVYIG